MKRRDPYRFAELHYLLIQVLYWAAACGYYAFGASYLYSEGLSGGATGAVFAAAGALSAVAQPLIASLKSERLPTARLAALLAAPAAACLLLIGRCSGSPWLSALLYAAAWMLLIALQFLLNAMAMEYQNAGVRLNFGVGRAFGSAGYALAGYLLGLACARRGYGITVSYGAVMTGLLLLALLLWPAAPGGQAEPSPRPFPESLEPGGFLRRYKRFALFLCGCMLNMTAYCTACSYLIRIVEDLGGGSRELGAATMIAALFEIPTVLLSLRLNRRFGSGKLMRLTAVMLSVKMLLIMLAPSIPFLYGAETLQLVSYSLYLSITVYYANARMREQDRLKGQAAVSLVQTAGSALGALLGGLLLDAAGVAGFRIFCMAASCVGSLVMVLGTETVA